MKIIGIPRINALGKVGPEKMPKAVFEELKKNFEILKIDNSNVEESERIIYEKSLEVFSSEDKVCFVGGDHSITYPLFKGFSEKNKDAFLIVFDAHADLMPAMKEPTHEEFLRAIVENGFNPESIILLGVRKIEKIEREFLLERKIKVFEEINDFEALADFVTEKAMGKDIYVSVDIDVIDPAFAPAVNYPEVGGITSKDFFYLLRRILKTKGIKALDVVEAIPQTDKNFDNRTIKICAKIIEEFENLV